MHIYITYIILIKAGVTCFIVAIYYKNDFKAEKPCFMARERK